MRRSQKNAPELVTKMQHNENTWSDWEDCNENMISEIPQVSGVYMMHTSMKILCIRGAENIKVSVREQLLHPCITGNVRLRYMETQSYEMTAEELIQEYKNRHGGEVPS